MLSTSLLLAASMVMGQADATSGMPEELRDHLNMHLIGEWTFKRIWDDQKVEGD